MIELAGAMELRTTVAGVRSSRIAATARHLGADYAQGLFWAAPVAASVIDQFMIERPIGGSEAPSRPLAGVAVNTAPGQPLG